MKYVTFTTLTMVVCVQSKHLKVRISDLSTHYLVMRVNKFGFIETPYRKVDLETGQVTNQVDCLTADEEDEYIVAQANSILDENGHL